MSDYSDDESEADVFDDELYRATAHSEIDERLLNSLEKAKETIRSFVVDEFLVEAIAASTVIRNLLGDADGFAYDLAESIRANLTVVAMEIKADPGGFVLAAARACKNPKDMNALLDNVTTKITEFKNQIN